MAESVNYYMDLMTKDLDDLAQHESIISGQELQELVRQLNLYEYRLQRRICKPSDFFDYAAYLKALHQLISLRRQRLISQQQMDPVQAASFLRQSQYCWLSKTHQIYRRLLAKQQGNLDAWMAWLDWCREARSWKIMERVFADALRFHPRNARLWSDAALWQWRQMSRIEVSRGLMARALRLMPEDGMLWKEYFAIEVDFALRCWKRQRVLGITSNNNGADMEVQVDANGQSLHVGAHAIQVKGQSIQIDSQSVQVNDIDLVEDPLMQEPEQESVESAAHPNSSSSISLHQLAKDDNSNSKSFSIDTASLSQEQAENALLSGAIPRLIVEQAKQVLFVGGMQKEWKSFVKGCIECLIAQWNELEQEEEGKQGQEGGEQRSEDLSGCLWLKTMVEDLKAML